MRVIYDNIFTVDQISATNENNYFPVSNLVDGKGKKPFRTVNNQTSTVITIDTTVDTTADSIAIHTHNFTSQVSITLTNADGLNETIPYREGLIVYFFTGATSDVWTLTISDSTNPDGYIYFGELYLAEYLQLTPSSLGDFSIEYQRNDKTGLSQDFVLYSTQGEERRVFTYTFPDMIWVDYQKYRTLYRAVGNWKPFIFCNFDTDYTIIEPCMARIENVLKENIKTDTKFSIEYIFGEVK